MTARLKGRWLVLLAVSVAVFTAGTLTATVAADPIEAESGPSNPDQAYGPGIISIEQTNMCMWGSLETVSCFPNSLKPDEAGWEAQERQIAADKRDSLITQARRHLADVITVSEGCLTDLQTVADAIGYQLRYQDTGDGSDGKPRQCTVGRGAGVNAILAKEFTGDGPQGYFQDKGYRSYICVQVSTKEWDSVRVCTAHLSLASQGGKREIECEIMRDTLDDSAGYVIFAGDMNMKGANQHCAPSRFHGLKNLERGDQTPWSGLQHIYYSANGFWRQSCAWSYLVSHTDHRGFLLELGKTKPPDRGPCWRNINE